jgi:Zn ribbon nucleic-acid-binding protein
MDFMFEDDVDEVGSDVEAYCPKCKADTTHVVISKYEDEIRRVQCNPCGDVHSFRKPRGEAEEDMPEPVAARKRALLKKLTWEEFFAKHGERNAKPYEFRETYRENAIVFHPKFGKGYVSEVVSESKVEITFSDARRILVHNRKDIPGSPVGREDDGLPSTTAPVKSGGKGTAKAVEKQPAKPASVPSQRSQRLAAKKPEDKKSEARSRKTRSRKTRSPGRRQEVRRQEVRRQEASGQEAAPGKVPAAKKPRRRRSRRPRRFQRPRSPRSQEAARPRSRRPRRPAKKKSK